MECYGTSHVSRVIARENEHGFLLLRKSQYVVLEFVSDFSVRVNSPLQHADPASALVPARDPDQMMTERNTCPHFTDTWEMLRPDIWPKC